MKKNEFSDSLLDEIHEIRRRISAEHGHDLKRLVEHYMEYQKQFAGRLIFNRERTPKQPDAKDGDKSAA
jgi:hypothetical protein